MVDYTLGRPLPRREEEILLRAAQGMTDKEIAADLGISPETVSTYWRRIRLRFSAVSRTEVVAIALKQRADAEIKEAQSANVELTRELEETERMRRAMAASEARWRSLVENSPDYVVEIDDGGLVTFMNRAMPSPWVTVGGSLFDLTTGADAERLRRQVRNVFAGQGPATVEFAVFPAGHAVTWLNARIALVPDRASGSRAIVIATDVTDRVHRDQRLSFRLAFEDLVTRISSRLLNVEGTQIDEEIDAALMSLGRFLGVDTTYIYEYDPDLTICRTTYRWSSEVMPPDPEALTRSYTSGPYPWWTGMMRRGETIHVPSVAQMPPEAASEQRVMQDRGVQSLVAVPLTVDGQTRGFIGFDTVRERRTWPDDQLSLVRILGELFAGALERRRNTEQLEQLAMRQKSLLRCAAELLEAGTEAMVTERLGELASEFLDFDCVGLYVVDARAGGIKPVHLTRSHLADPRFEKYVIPLGQGILGQTVATGQASVVNDSHLDPRSVYPEGMEPQLEHLIALPVALGGTRPGAMLFSRFRPEEPFTDEEFEMTKFFARYAELATRGPGCDACR